MTTRSIALTGDLGESFGAYTIGDDEALLDLLTSANIACGFHAGDPRVMDRTVRAALERGVELGAHPGFPDLGGFGRRAMDLSYDEVRTDILYQVGALDAFACAHGGRLSHVTPHGRLGNLVITDPTYARAVTDAVVAYDELLVVTQEGELARAAREKGLRVGIMFLADRAYEDDGTLVRRTEPGALIHDVEEIAARTVRMATEGLVTSAHGRDIPVDCDVVLLHGDHPQALGNGHALRNALIDAGVVIEPLRAVLDRKAKASATA